MLLTALSPLLLVVAILIRTTTRGPVLFRQQRVGHCESRFTMLKFQSLKRAPDEQILREQIQRELSGEQQPESGSFKPRVDDLMTPIGRWLRRTSIDELPQLLNVLRGDMSLVGPRPCLDWEHELFEPRFRRRVQVPPGITGLWQVSGRSTLDTREMLELDLRYVETRSMRLDIEICLKTVPTLIRGDGAR
jgi:lipopolysaccharide/colanic/teichoic acid biosynthesis glycosyltransferase